jgi:hypothetical protein
MYSFQAHELRDYLMEAFDALEKIDEIRGVTVSRDRERREAFAEINKLIPTQE